jgi:hypothetical protein
MENYLYNGKLTCTFDLKDENGLYYEEQVHLVSKKYYDAIMDEKF